jgi:hypothetical protein
MTFYEAIKKAIISVLDQGCVSVSVDGSVANCVYRGPEGVKCAVGHIIDDEYYQPEMEGLNASFERVTKAVGKSIGLELDTNQKDILSVLQLCHDDCKDVEDLDFRTAFITKIETKVRRGSLPEYCIEIAHSWLSNYQLEQKGLEPEFKVRFP